MRAHPACGRGGAIAEFGDGAAEGALPKRRFDKAIAALCHGDHHKYLQDVLPPGRVVNVGDRVHEEQQWIVPQVDAVGTLADPYERLGGQDSCDHALGLHAGRNNHEREDGAQQRASAILKRGIAVGKCDHGGKANQTHDAQHIDGCGRGPKAHEGARLRRVGIAWFVDLLARLALGVIAVLGGASQAIEPQTMSETHRR